MSEELYFTGKIPLNIIKLAEQHFGSGVSPFRVISFIRHNYTNYDDFRGKFNSIDSSVNISIKRKFNSIILAHIDLTPELVGVFNKKYSTSKGQEAIRELWKQLDETDRYKQVERERKRNDKSEKGDER